MRTLVDARLREEAARFQLRHRCDDCVHFADDACANEWPTAEHRATLADTHTELVVFCKEFEGA